MSLPERVRAIAERRLSRFRPLHGSDRNGRWHLYDGLAPSPDLDTLLAEIGDDPTGIFWG